MTVQGRSYRWFSFLTALFVITLVTSNIIAVKVVHILGLFLPAAVILFPITYIFGDVLTEVYGFTPPARSSGQVFSATWLRLWLSGLADYCPQLHFGQPAFSAHHRTPSRPTRQSWDFRPGAIGFFFGVSGWRVFKFSGAGPAQGANEGSFPVDANNRLHHSGGGG